MPVCVVLRPAKKGRRIEVRISHVQGAKIIIRHEFNHTNYTNVVEFSRMQR
jgi:hypothetical protein